MTPLLDIQHLRVSLPTPRGVVQAVRDVSLHIDRGEMLAIVGESGCGKSVTAQALMQLLPSTARIDCQRASRPSMAMIFQNPMATFNPTLSIGYQIAEPLRVHRAFNRHDAETETVRLLSRMGIENAQQRARQYPHQFSGGMLQRAAIAMALAMQPELLIADEPTTALDVSTQAEVMNLLAELRSEQQLALLFISHDLGLVSRHADRVAVMYAGEIVETASTHAVLQQPLHPYTRALIASLPSARSTRLQSIDGSPPDLLHPPVACAFCERCSQRMQICARQTPPLLARDTQAARCWLLHPLAPASGADT
ncbi:MAG TPA: ABC transporter ATP-binding protein [Pseudomonadales bacterium]|nr:ABC transporter ATP-binding protein [Pseudomonadales bacterium]